RRGRLRLLAVDLLGFLVLAEALVRRCAQVPVVGPFRELDLGDELRLHPDDVRAPDTRHLRHLRERRLLALDRPEQPQEPVDLGVGEAGADVSDEPELAALVPDREHERTEALRAPALPLRVAGDQELLARARLDLQPVARAPARLVARVLLLRDHTLEPLGDDRLVERLAVVERVRVQDRAVAPVEEVREPRAPVDERQVDERLALDLEQVEDVVDDRRTGLALLHQREARPPLLVESADLAVEHAVRRLQRLRQLARDVREALRVVLILSRLQTRIARGETRDDPVAVELHLELPLRPLRELRGQRREHRGVVALLRRRRAVLALLEQEPVLRVSVELRGDERPQALEPFAVQAHGEAPVPLLLDELVGAPIPDLDRTGAVLPLRDLALERGVLERMVLDVDGEALLARLERDPLWHCPARERAGALEPEVVVETPGVVSLDDEDRLAGGPLRAERLGSRLRVALAPVLGELRHLRSFTGRAAFRRLLTRLLLLRALNRLLERLHQVDDLGLFLLLGLGQLLPLRLRTKQREQLLAVPVVVLLGLERRAEVLDEGLRHLDLGLAQLALLADLLRLPHLVGVVHGLEHEDVLPDAQRRQMLLVADHDLRDRDPPRLLERTDEQHVRLLRALVREQVVGLPKVDRVDLLERDEVADLDRVRQLDVEAVDVLVLERHELALRDLEAPDDVLGVDRLAVVPPDLLVADRRHVPLVQEMEAHLLGLGRCVHPDRDADETERDRPPPDRARRHDYLVPGRTALSTGPGHGGKPCGVCG